MKVYFPPIPKNFSNSLLQVAGDSLPLTLLHLGLHCSARSENAMIDFAIRPNLPEDLQEEIRVYRAGQSMLKDAHSFGAAFTAGTTLLYGLTANVCSVSKPDAIPRLFSLYKKTLNASTYLAFAGCACGLANRTFLALSFLFNRAR